MLDQPSWFGAVMGTGAVALVAGSDPGEMTAFAGVSTVLSWAFFLMASGFFLFLLIRSVVVRRLWRGLRAQVTDPATGAGFATVPGAVNVLALGLLRVAGFAEFPAGRWIVLALAVIGTVLGLILTVVFFTAAFERQDFEAEDISGTWFIPETVILLGAVLFGDLSNVAAESVQRTAAVASFALLGIGLVLFGFTAMLFFSRLVLHRQSQQVGAPAMWIMLSPLSVSALAIQAVAADTSMLGGTWDPAVIQTANFLAAILWGFSLWWIAAAGVITAHLGRAALTFTAADWGFVFPTAAVVLATSTLGRFWQSGAMEALAVVFSLLLLLIWGAIFTASVYALRRDAADHPGGSTGGVVGLPGI